MKNIYWKYEEKYSIEDMEKFQKAMKSTKGNFLQFLSNRDSLLDLVELLHGESLKADCIPDHMEEYHIHKADCIQPYSQG